MGCWTAWWCWEGFALEQVLQIVRPREAYFWATHGGAELGLFFTHRGRRVGVEAKFQEAPQATKSMRIALETLALDHLWVLHPGPHTYPIDEQITVLSVGDLDTLTRSFSLLSGSLGILG